MENYGCSNCGCIVPGLSLVNYMMFCPSCNSYMYIECEYGYGPVTPCSIQHGGKSRGTITEKNSGYVLKIYAGEEIKLKKRYMEALDEARDIIVEGALLGDIINN